MGRADEMKDRPTAEEEEEEPKKAEASMSTSGIASNMC